MLRPARGLSVGVLRMASDKLVSGAFRRRDVAVHVGRDLGRFVELGNMASKMIEGDEMILAGERSQFI